LTLLCVWLETVLVTWLPLMAVPALIWVGIMWQILFGNAQKRWLWLLFFGAWSVFTTEIVTALVSVAVTGIFMEMLNFIYKKFMPENNIALFSAVGGAAIYPSLLIQYFIASYNFDFVLFAGRALSTIIMFAIVYYILWRTRGKK